MDIMNLMDVTYGNIQNVNLKTDTGSQNKYEFASMFQNFSVMNFTQVQTQQAQTSVDVNSTSSMDYANLNQRQNTIATAPEAKTEPVAEDVEKMNDFAKDVVATISDATNVDEETIEKVMAELGFGIADLLNPQNLASLVSELTETDDVAAMLLNEDFSNLLGQITELLTNLTEEIGIDSNELMMALETFEFDMTGEQLSSKEFDEVLAKIENPAIINEAAPESGAISESDETLQTANAVVSATPEVEYEITSEEKNTDKKITEQNETILESDETVETETFAKDMQTTDSRREDDSAKQDGSAKEEQNLTHAQNVAVINESNYSPSVEASFASSYSSIDTIDLIEQLASNLKITLASSETTMEMQLNPENLGKVLLQVSSKEGNVTATLTTTNEIVKEALEAQLATLRENLNSQGVKVDAIEVTVSSHAFERNLDGGQERERQEGQMAEQESSRRRNIRMDSLDDLMGLMSEEEMLVAQIMRDNGNSMDLTA